MGNPDKISMLLGKLEAQGVESGKKHDRVFKKLDEIQANVSALRDAARYALENSAAVEEKLANEISPAVKRLEKLSAKGLLIFAGLAAAFGAIGGFSDRLFNAFKAFFTT